MTSAGAQLDELVLDKSILETVPTASTITVRSVIENADALKVHSPDHVVRVATSRRQVIEPKDAHGFNFKTPEILNGKGIGIAQGSIVIGREVFEEYGKTVLSLACHNSGCPVTTSDDADVVQDALTKHWEPMPQEERLQWMRMAKAFNDQLVDDGRHSPLTPFGHVNGHDIFCEQWSRVCDNMVSTVNVRFKQETVDEVKERGALSCDSYERWKLVHPEVRGYCDQLAEDRNDWRLCKEQGERETWEVMQSNQILQDGLKGDSLTPGGIPKGFRRTDWSQVERTPENIAQGFKDADEYEEVRPVENWPDWMTYIPKMLRNGVCMDPSTLFPIAFKYVPTLHPCFESIEEHALATVPEELARKVFHDALKTDCAPLDDDFFVLKLIVTTDALTGELGSKYKSAFDKGWVTSWNIGVTHPDRMSGGSRKTPNQTWKVPCVASEVILTPKALSGNCPTSTLTAELDKAFLEKNPPPSTRSNNSEWLNWFKKTWLADLITYHYDQIELRAGAVEWMLKRENDIRDADEAANALLDEETRERAAAEAKIARKLRKRKEAAAQQAAQGNRAKAAAAAQKQALEEERKAKIAAKHAANERALEERRAAQKREQEAKFAKVLSEKNAKETKKTKETNEAHVDLMARLGLHTEPVQSGRGTTRGGRGVGVPRSPPAPPTTQEDDKVCVICLDEDKTEVCIPCGHRCLCAACAAANKPEKCPVCRADVAVVVFMQRVFE